MVLPLEVPRACIVLLCYLPRFFHARNVEACAEPIVNASALVNGDKFNFTCCCVVCLVFHVVYSVVADAPGRRWV
jgi:hypothetical protein